MAAVPAAGLFGSTALGGGDSFASQAFVVGVSPAVAVAHDPSDVSRHELPLLLPGDSDLAIAPDGHRLAFVSSRDGRRSIYVGDAETGQLRRLESAGRADDSAPAWSPDGKRLAWQRTGDSRSSIVVARADGAGPQVTVAEGGRNTTPSWSPRGDRIVFASNRDSALGLWVATVDGALLEPLVLLERAGRDPAWSPDGKTVAFASNGDLWRLDVASGVVLPVLRGRAIDAAPAWSPDGARLVFARTLAGRNTLHTIAPGGGRPRLIPGSADESEPQWATLSPHLVPPDGARLPDLDQRPPTDLQIVKLGPTWALGFTSAVENLGDGALLIRGLRRERERLMRADQVVEFADGRKLVAPEIGRLKYEPHPPHFHWHLQPFEAYTLRSVVRPSVSVRDRKSGFCLIDRYGNAVLPAPRVAPPRFTSNCATGQPNARTVLEGSSPGYRDRYPAFFHGQDVVVSGLSAGVYVLSHQANPLRALREKRYTNNAASVRLRLSWPEGRGRKPVVEVLDTCETSAVCPP